MELLRTRVISVCVAGVILGALAACGADDDAPSSSGDTDAAAQSTAGATGDGAAHGEREEVSSAQPRLVVATNNGVVVLDADDGEVLGAFDTEIRPWLTVGGDARHVYLVQTDADITQVLDGGSWATGHGDHFHYYVQEPALRDVEIEGEAPVHVVPHDGMTAIFHDDAGTATVFPEEGLLIDSLASSEIGGGTPHHGVVVPTAQGNIVSIPPAPTADTTLPTGVAIVDETGDQAETFDDCPELHGEAAAGDVAVFACEDGLLFLADHEGSTVPYPSDEGRVGSFTPGAVDHVLVGNYTEQSLLAVDIDTMTTQEITLDEPYAARHMDAHGNAVVLTTDGSLHVIDPSTGDVDTSVAEVLPAFEIPEDWQEPRPTLAVAGHTAYVADPAQSIIVPVDLDSGSIGDAFALDDAPTGIVGVGEPPHTH